MRELAVRIEFKSHCLGNVKHSGGRFLLLRSPTTDRIVFMPTWHCENLRFAARLLGRCQKEVSNVCWNPEIECRPRDYRDFYRRYYRQGKRNRFSSHEAIMPKEIVTINCVVPTSISDDDLWQLLSLAGQYKGISPYKPGEFGFFAVESIMPRRVQPAEIVINAENEVIKKKA